jgi:hypothetical protein
MFAETANVRHTCAVTSIPRPTVYAWLKSDEAFRKAWDEAVELGTGALEDEAVRRAYHGVKKPVFYQGKKCGYIREYSDGMLWNLLKARRPEKYKDRVANEFTGKDGGQIVVKVLGAGMSMEDL